MHASAKLNLVITSIFIAVFLTSSVGFWLLSTRDIRSETQAALAQAEVLIASEISGNIIYASLSRNPHISLIALSNNADSDAERTFYVAQQRYQIVANEDAEFDEIIGTLTLVLALFSVAWLTTIISVKYAVNSRLKPLIELQNGLDAMSQGQLDFAVEANDITEIQSLVEHYKNTQSILQDNEAQILAMQSQLVNVQEKERKFLARELHDNIGQIISAIQIQSYVLSEHTTNNDNTSDQSEIANCIIEQCANLQQELKRLTHQLHPVVLAQLGLREALRNHCAYLDERFAPKIDYSETININTWKDDEERDIQLFRICQEALTNAIKHSRASTISICIQQIDRAVTITIKDNGVGLNSQATPVQPLQSLGMHTMHERSRLANATLHVNNNTDENGVSVVCCFSIDAT